MSEFTWVCDVINSCKTIQQLNVAMNVVHSYHKHMILKNRNTTGLFTHKFFEENKRISENVSILQDMYTQKLFLLSRSA